MSKKTAGVPLLLESFPEPPSFIPHSPLPSTPLLTINPPPSRPPATPLPPVPGPSRFSWQEAQRLLHGHEDSISDISMHDLPVDDDDDDDLNAITTKVSPTKPSTPHRKSSFTARPIVVSQSTSSIPTGRAASPEITDIISRTPRPRRSSSTTFSVRSTSTPRPPPSSSRRRASSPINHTYNSSSTFTASAAWEEGDFIDDYTSLERQLEGDGSDSDSSLDLHTPLPHLMVKHGLLSPRSKLIGKSTSLDSLSSEEGSDPRASTISLAASTKSSILKDTRDTPRRRVRHRDGKLLRGGLGLTTGLGWSDSEDEDAPSPLTKRISSLNLRRAASEAGDEDNTRRMTRSSSASLGSTWRSTMSSGYTAPPSRLSSSSSISSYHPPRSRASSSSTSSSYNHPPVASRGFERALQSGLMEEGDVLKPTKVPKIRTSSVDKDKLLPSLPNPRTGSIRRPTPSQIRADQEVRRTTSTGTLERKRSMLPAGPRTLRLPSCPVISTSLSSPGSERAVPVPRIPLNKPPLSPMSPRPRTGTGMVYKSHGVTL